MPNGDLLFTEQIIILLLLIATLVAIVFRRFRIPYTVGLVLVGTALAIFRPSQATALTPCIIMGLLVPPLLFEAAFHLEINDLRQHARTITLLAIPGVIITMLLVGAVVTWGTDLSLPLALVFGSLIAATDPVAVIALFRSMGVPKRLQLLLEGESLFNDGTAVVIFGLALAAAQTGEFSFIDSTLDFLRIAGGGILAGVLSAVLVSYIISRVKDPLIETSLTFILAYGSFLLAENMHLSGVLAVVAAGIFSGNMDSRSMSPTTRIAVFNFWEFASFLANSFAFLLIGLEVEIPLLLENWKAILVGILAVLFARAFVVYAATSRRPNIPFAWRHILFWGGLRGAIALALVLSLPLSLGPARSQLQAMAFGVVLFTLLVQGLTMQPIVDRLNIAPRHEMRERFNLHKAQVTSLKSAHLHLKEIHEEGLISESTWKRVSGVLKAFIGEVTVQVRDLLVADPELAREDLDLAWREVLRSQRSALIQLYTSGAIDEEAFSELVGRIDATLEKGEIKWAVIEELLPDLTIQ
ncbi:MAG: Na+/H+ antiporter [Chloroflexi bacterium]|nr:Na+/H+ antiporter [Chloroflexota bacterium]MQC26743.1 Na+/H+ antiporter [Chloroflexota bacterium]